MFSDFFLAADCNLSRSALEWGVKTGRWRRVARGAYRKGPQDPTRLDLVLGVLVATRGIATGLLAGWLLGLDSMRVVVDVAVPIGSAHKRPGVSRRDVPPDRIVHIRGFDVTNGFQTMLDLACRVDDLGWEQALESALHKRLINDDDLVCMLGFTGRGAARINRVLALRPPGTTPTESLLETHMVQLARLIPDRAPPAGGTRLRIRRAPPSAARLGWAAVRVVRAGGPPPPPLPGDPGNREKGPRRRGAGGVCGGGGGGGAAPAPRGGKGGGGRAGAAPGSSQLKTTLALTCGECQPVGIF